jgi:hypothetical protein
MIFVNLNHCFDMEIVMQALPFLSEARSNTMNIKLPPGGSILRFKEHFKPFVEIGG